MKKLLRVVSVIVVLSMLLIIPVQAQGAASTRASAFFAAYGTVLEKISSTSFRVWFDVDANAKLMQELGTSEIVVYKSSDQENWTPVKTYTKENYSNMIDTNSYSYIAYLSYSSAVPGYYYMARVTFYAKNSSGVGMLDEYTEIIKM